MASNAEIKQHISSAERAKWNKVIADFTAHLGSGGTENHILGNGTTAGFSLNNFTTEEKDKLAGVQEGALNNPHPSSHPWTMIDGLTNLAHTGSWTDLNNVPQKIKDVENGCADAATVSGGIRITIGPNAPSNPQNNKEIWINTNTKLLQTIINGTWEVIGAVFR